MVVSKRDPTVLVCHRITDLPIPNVRAFKADCQRCGAPVWVAYSSPTADTRACMPCLADLVVDEIAQPTPQQVADIRSFLRAPKN
jgi:hypothetical protein